MDQVVQALVFQVVQALVFQAVQALVVQVQAVVQIYLLSAIKIKCGREFFPSVIMNDEDHFFIIYFSSKYYSK